MREIVWKKVGGTIETDGSGSCTICYYFLHNWQTLVLTLSSCSCSSVRSFTGSSSMSWSASCLLRFIAMHTWKSWYRTGTKSFVSWTSNSTRSAPADAAFFREAIVFSRTSAHLQTNTHTHHYYVLLAGCALGCSLDELLNCHINCQYFIILTLYVSIT